MELLGSASATEAVRTLHGMRSPRLLNPTVWPALVERQKALANA
jgi:hypothetical protein